MNEDILKKELLKLKRVLNRFGDVLALPDIATNEYLHDAAIQRFEFTVGLFCKILSNILFCDNIDTRTPLETIGKAYHYKLIDNDKMWFSLLDDKNMIPHISTPEEAYEIFTHLEGYYLTLHTTYQYVSKKFLA